ncbi:MAG: hypothetical protein ABIU05_00845, partial [Nitrospirales bacterium]
RLSNVQNPSSNPVLAPLDLSSSSAYPFRWFKNTPFILKNTHERVPMPGLDLDVIKLLNPKQALGRINTDILTDFILAPHYSAIYAHAGDDLWEAAKMALSSGSYEPELPITIDVPKKSGLTRPGSILSPLDRFVYQALIDLIAPA